MNERRKIIIPIGGNPNEPLSTPQFDAESTMAAQRVVPLADQETFQMHYGEYRASTGKPFWKSPWLIALVVLIVVGVGVAAAFAISAYRNRSAVQPSFLPPSTVENSGVGQPVEEPAATPQTRTAVPEKTAEPSIEEQDVELPTPPVVRNDKRDQPDRDNDPVAGDQQTERDRRREERRERRRRQREEDRTLDVPRQIERAGREINGRIREVFEGRQP